jgi:hypothetical protein
LTICAFLHSPRQFDFHCARVQNEPKQTLSCPTDHLLPTTSRGLEARHHPRYGKRKTRTPLTQVGPCSTVCSLYLPSSGRHGRCRRHQELRRRTRLQSPATAQPIALELSVELQAAMKGIVREGSQELPAVSSGDAEVHRLYLGLERDNLSSYDNSALYDKALSDLMASNSEHTNSSHHWLDPIIISQTFPEFFKDHKPDYSSLASTGQADTQPAQQSSDADSHRDRSPRDGDWLRAQTPRSTLRDELKIFDTPRRGW